MRLSDLTTQSVLQAIGRYDDLGQSAFFEEYGFSNALEYFLLHGGKAYDSKAIAGVAHGYVTGDFRELNNFSGGLPVARRLRELGFEVTGGSDWEWDELILASDLVASNDWQTISEDNPQVWALSDYLRSQENARYSERFRSTGSVHRKLEDLRTAHPEYSGTRTRGGRATRQVVEAFVAEPDKMHLLAVELWRNGNLARGEDDGLGGPEEEPGGDNGAVYAEAVEGRVVERLVKVRERDPKLRRGKIEQSRKERRCISCEACGFDFEKVFGQLGLGFIHVHHRVPLHFSGETKSTFDDLVLLCVNCHQMIHRHSPWKTLEELRAIIASTIR